MSPAPVRAGAAVDDLLGSDTLPPGITARNPLRVANYGENAPLCAQFVFYLLAALPREVASRPGSAAFRAAARELSARTGVPYLEPTRGDISAGVAWLERRGFLPPWVFTASTERTDHANKR